MTITAHCYPGLSMQVRIMQGATPVGSILTMTESAQAGYYTVATPGGLADGAYTLLLINGSQVIGQRDAVVRSGVFVDPAVLPDIAPAVRTNLATELGRLDAAVSTRAAPGAAMALTPAERSASAAVIEAALLADGDGQAFVNAIVAAIGNTNVNQAVFVAAIRADLERVGGMLDLLPTASEIVTAVDASTQLAKASAVTTLQTTATAIKAKTDALPAAPAAVGDIPSASTVAAAVRTNLTTELGRIDVAVSTREAESAAAARAVTNQTEHDATQAAIASAAATNQTEHDATQVGIAAIAAIGNPLNQPVPGSYPAGSAGEALGKLLVGPPDEPAVVIPGPPADVGLCRVYGYVEGINNDKRLPTARIEFRLIAPDGTKAVASERLIGERAITIKVDGLGRLQGEDGQPWIDLQRNDMLTPAGTTYEVTSAALGISRKSITLTTTIADLRTLLLA